jgi:hypothetical protein
VNLLFQPRRPSPSSLRNRRLPRSDRGALCVSALSFSSSFSTSLLPLCAHAGTPATPLPSAIYFISCGHPRVEGTRTRRSHSRNSVQDACPGSLGAPKPTRPSTPADPFNAKPSTPSLTPLSATLTKNWGEGANSASGPCRAVLLWMTAFPIQFLNLSAGRELLAQSREGSARRCQRKSFIRNAYKKAGGGAPATHLTSRRRILPRRQRFGPGSQS